jgi:uncharacterized protein with PIN domain
MEESFERKAMRCINCGAFIEIPSPEIQQEEIREKYFAIMAKIHFPCPECDSHQPMVTEDIIIVRKF